MKQFIACVFVVLLAVAFPVAAQNSADTVTASQDTVTRIDTLIQRVIPAQLADTTRDTTGVSESEARGEAADLQDLTQLISLRKVLLVILIFVIIYFLNRFTAQILDNLSERFSTYRLEIKRLIPVIRITLWSFAIYITIAGVIDPPYETIIAVLASIGIAVGFAAQDILKNIFGGFMIIMDRPFQVGDKIEVGEYYGEVFQIRAPLHPDRNARRFGCDHPQRRGDEQGGVQLQLQRAGLPGSC
ncbi:MAG: mechanosensitive ion channel [Balneolaceae bacterium]|nr:mechanosensitive ion channel [Balneolaceae bacterium]